MTARDSSSGCQASPLLFPTSLPPFRLPLSRKWRQKLKRFTFDHSSRFVLRLSGECPSGTSAAHPLWMPPSAAFSLCGSFPAVLSNIVPCQGTCDCLTCTPCKHGLLRRGNPHVHVNVPLLLLESDIRPCFVPQAQAPWARPSVSTFFAPKAALSRSVTTRFLVGFKLGCRHGLLECNDLRVHREVRCLDLVFLNIWTRHTFCRHRVIRRHDPHVHRKIRRGRRRGGGAWRIHRRGGHFMPLSLSCNHSSHQPPACSPLS